MSNARGRIWSAIVEADHYETLRSSVHVLQAQRHESGFTLRIAHPHLPCSGARAVEPNLEEALMAQRYATSEMAA